MSPDFVMFTDEKVMVNFDRITHVIFQPGKDKNGKVVEAATICFGNEITITVTKAEFMEQVSYR